MTMQNTMPRTNVCRIVVSARKTGLYHGTTYRNYPAPNYDNWLLALITTTGFMSPRSAARAINKVSIPGVALLNEQEFEDRKIPTLRLRLPIGTEIVLVRPHDQKRKPYVQYLKDGSYNKTDIVPQHLPFLEAMGRIVPDSVGFPDSALSETYDVYFTTSTGKLQLTG